MRLEQMANKVEQLEENEEEEELKQLDITNASKKTVRAKSVPAHLAASRKEVCFNLICFTLSTTAVGTTTCASYSHISRPSIGGTCFGGISCTESAFGGCS